MTRIDEYWQGIAHIVQSENSHILILLGVSHVGSKGIYSIGITQ